MTKLIIHTETEEVICPWCGAICKKPNRSYGKERCMNCFNRFSFKIEIATICDTEKVTE
jgi:hypothetical protein